VGSNPHLPLHVFNELRVSVRLQQSTCRGNEVAGETEILDKKQFERLKASVPRWKSQQAKSGQRLDRFSPQLFPEKIWGRLRLAQPKGHIASSDLLLRGQMAHVRTGHPSRSRSIFAFVLLAISPAVLCSLAGCRVRKFDVSVRTLPTSNRSHKGCHSARALV
jgi:hypothetical protein